MASGISRGSRPILRAQPQLRLDCSPAMWPFSHSTTGMPLRARKNAVLVPMMPPPTTTTPVRAGSSVSDVTGSTRGAIRELHDRLPDQSAPRTDRQAPGFMSIGEVGSAFNNPLRLHAQTFNGQSHRVTYLQEDRFRFHTLANTGWRAGGDDV